MKVYLASSFDLTKKVEALAGVLRKNGHVVTVEWWNKDFKKLPLTDVDWYEDARVTAISERNFRGIREADIFVLIAPTLTSKKFNGANVELGYALALGKPCYSVGRLQRSAMYVPVIKCESMEEVLERCARM
jgi:nucleoside 2-deoxyribosyltransferase